MEEEKVKELLKAHSAPLTYSDLKELTKSASEEEDDPEAPAAAEKEELMLENLLNILWRLKDATDQAYSCDHFMVRALQFKRAMETASLPYKTMLDNMKR